MICFLRFFGVSIQCSEFTVAPFYRKFVNAAPSEFYNTVNMAFPREASLLNFCGSGDCGSIP